MRKPLLFCFIFSTFHLGLISLPGSAFAQNTPPKKQIRTLDLEIEFSGDWAAKVQFNGPLGTGELLKGDVSPASKDCQLSAKFYEVLLPAQDSMGSKEKNIQVYFEFDCLQDGKKNKIVIGPEYIRASDLKVSSASLYISPLMKSVKYKVTTLQF